MEGSPNANTRRGDGYFLYSPFYCCEQLVKAILKCLGVESAPYAEPSQDAADSPLNTESHTKPAEQYAVKSRSTTITVQRAIMKKPQIKGGRGEEHN